HGVASEACLAITFTRRAATEMRERLAVFFPENGTRVFVTTFHALGFSIFREHETKLGLRAPLRVGTEREVIAFAREVFGLSATEARKLAADVEASSRATEFREALRSRGLLTFDDLIRLTVELLKTQPDVAEACRARWPHVCVDEYQDVDQQQYELVNLL